MNTKKIAIMAGLTFIIAIACANFAGAVFNKKVCKSIP